MRLAKVAAGSRLLEGFMRCPAHKGPRGSGGDKKQQEASAAAAAGRLQKWIEKWTQPLLRTPSAGDDSTSTGQQQSLADKLASSQQQPSDGAGAGEEPAKKKQRRGRNRDAPPVPETGSGLNPAAAPPTEEGGEPADEVAAPLAPVRLTALDKTLHKWPYLQVDPPLRFAQCFLESELLGFGFLWVSYGQ
eukprot:COSAG05_NODE_1129_length_5779_cov_11.914789_4_plen_190_part_00